MNTTTKKPNPYAELMLAHAYGAVIEVLKNGVWMEAQNPNWLEQYQYRIQPHEVKQDPHAECIDAFFKGAEIQYRKDETAQWTDTQDPNWHEVLQYRVKPVAMVYPESRIEDIASIAYPTLNHTVPLLRDVANAAIRRAIDDGQVVRAGAPVSTPAGTWREDFGELSIVGPRLLVEQAVKQLEQVNSPAEIAANKAFDKRLELAEAALETLGYTRYDVEGHWKRAIILDAEMDRDFQEVGEAENLRQIEELKDRLDVLPARACRALCEYLGKSRDDVSFEVIQAIILLERNKP